MDESTPTCNKRFASLGIPQTVAARRAYREMIVTTAGLRRVHQRRDPLRRDDPSAKERRHSFRQSPHRRGNHSWNQSGCWAPRSWPGHPGEKVTEGLDGLRDRLAEYCSHGRPLCQMARSDRDWRRIFPVGAAFEANAHALARYAALCQEAGLVPVVEPEVLMDGDHTLDTCFEVTDKVLRTVFSELFAQRVMLEGMILKPNMVVPGSTCPHQEAVDEVADATVNCLLRAVPAAVPAIAFLSGGQSAELASARLNAMNVRFKSRLPWALAFSFARAIQQPALELWKGQDANVLAAQQALYHRARCNQAARRGEYSRQWRRDDRKQAQPRRK